MLDERSGEILNIQLTALDTKYVTIDCIMYTSPWKQGAIQRQIIYTKIIDDQALLYVIVDYEETDFRTS